MTTDPAPLEPLGAVAGILAGGLVIYFAISAGIIALGIWAWYTVTWRAIRRGLHEFHHNPCPPKLHKVSQATGAMYPPSSWR